VGDFMRITTDSGAIRVHLIEIESPTKPLFTRRGQPTAVYTQAMAQLADWKHWMSNLANQMRFRDMYRVPRSWDRAIIVDYTLIYGRRVELEASPRGVVQRRNLSPPDFHSMTYDRLRPQPDGSHDITARYARGSLVAAFIPPTFPLSTSMLNAVSELEGLVLAIEASEIAVPRRIYLGRAVPIVESAMRAAPLKVTNSREITPADLVRFRHLARTSVPARSSP
jgi:hypothetical protein